MKNLILKGLRHLRQLCVIASLNSAVCKLFCRKGVKLYKNGMNEAFNKKYTIVNPDEYDKQYGLAVEIGIITVEDYYFTKGYFKGQEVFQLLHPNKI
jgi:hypothetical protein